jgi:hypothetical protein
MLYSLMMVGAVTTMGSSGHRVDVLGWSSCASATCMTTLRKPQPLNRGPVLGPMMEVGSWYEMWTEKMASTPSSTLMVMPRMGRAALSARHATTGERSVPYEEIAPMHANGWQNLMVKVPIAPCSQATLSGRAQAATSTHADVASAALDNASFIIDACTEAATSGLVPSSLASARAPHPLPKATPLLDPP